MKANLSWFSSDVMEKESDTRCTTNRLIFSSLQEHGFAVTPHRQAIINQICEEKLVEDIEETWLNIRRQTTISWATMYVTVNLLIKLGWLVPEKAEDRNKKQYRLVKNQDFNKPCYISK